MDGSRDRWHATLSRDPVSPCRPRVAAAVPRDYLRPATAP